MIAVQYRDGRFDMVKSPMLDQLIAEGGIMLFRRTSGWVVVDRDPVRSSDVATRYYVGTERRSQSH